MNSKMSKDYIMKEIDSNWSNGSVTENLHLNKLSVARMTTCEVYNRKKGQTVIRRDKK